MSRIVANLLLLLTGAVWGMGFIAQSTAMDAMGPWTYTAAKFALAALTLAPFALAETRRAPRPLDRRLRGGFVLVGLSLFAGAIAQQFGILTTSVTNAGFLTGLYVVLTPILALLFLKRAPARIVWPAALLAFAGIFLLSGGHIGALSEGDLLVTLSALFFAVQILLIDVVGGSSGRAMTLSFVQFAVVTVLSVVGMLVFETPRFAPLLEAWPQVIYGGVFSTGLAFTLQIVGQRYTTAPQAAIFLSSEALFAALFGRLMLDERILPIGYLGCAMIFIAMLLVELVPAMTQRRAARGRSSRTGAEQPGRTAKS